MMIRIVSMTGKNGLLLVGNYKQGQQLLYIVPQILGVCLAHTHLGARSAVLIIVFFQAKLLEEFVVWLLYRHPLEGKLRLCNKLISLLQTSGPVTHKRITEQV